MSNVEDTIEIKRLFNEISKFMKNVKFEQIDDSLSYHLLYHFEMLNREIGVFEVNEQRKREQAND